MSQTKLLFRSWDITEPYQFVLTWFAVMFIVITYFVLAQFIAAMDWSMINLLTAEREKDAKIQSSLFLYNIEQFQRSPRPVGWSSLKVLHSLVTGFNYGLSLMIMLIAMSFIPSLFLAIFIGGCIGEFLTCDFRLDLSMGLYSPLSTYSGISGWIIRRVLCLPISLPDDSVQQPSGSSTLEKNHVLSDRTKSVLWLLPRLISMILVIVVIVWVYQTQGAFMATSVFGYHALFMTLFIAVFTNEALLSYAIPLLPQLANDRKNLRYIVYTFEIRIFHFVHCKESTN